MNIPLIILDFQKSIYFFVEVNSIYYLQQIVYSFLFWVELSRFSLDLWIFLDFDFKDCCFHFLHFQHYSWEAFSNFLPFVLKDLDKNINFHCGLFQSINCTIKSLNYYFLMILFIFVLAKNIFKAFDSKSNRSIVH